MGLAVKQPGDLQNLWDLSLETVNILMKFHADTSSFCFRSGDALTN